MKKPEFKIVRWTAIYETLVEVKPGEDVQDNACDIDPNVIGSKYQEDTWEVTSVRDATPEEISNHTKF